MATSLRKLQTATLADTTAVEFELSDTPVLVPSDLFIEVDSTNSDTIQFQVAKKGTLIASLDWTNIVAAAAGKLMLPITLRNGDYNLYARAGAAGQKFSVGY